MVSGQFRRAGLPRVDVDLDAPAAQRWDAAVDAKGKQLRAVAAFVAAEIARWPLRLRLLAWLLQAALAALSWLQAALWDRDGPAAELRGVARRAGVPAGLLAAMQLVYEATSACTSLVVEDAGSGCPVHLRTMDWCMPFDLRPLTVHAAFSRGGRVVFEATTWVGFVGVYTGVARGVGAVSINFRQTADTGFAHNALSALLGGWTVGRAVRDALTRADSYDALAEALEHVPLVAPTYVIVSGVRAGQGAVFSRGRRRSERPVYLAGGPLVQVNSDHWNSDPLNDLFEGHARRQAAQQLLAVASAGDLQSRWGVLSAPFITHEGTVYGTIMSAAPETYVCEGGARKGRSWGGQGDTLLESLVVSVFSDSDSED